MNSLFLQQSQLQKEKRPSWLPSLGCLCQTFTPDLEDHLYWQGGGTVSLRAPASLHPGPGHFRLWRSCWLWACGLKLTRWSGFGKITQGSANMGRLSLTPHRRGGQRGLHLWVTLLSQNCQSVQGEAWCLLKGFYFPHPRNQCWAIWCYFYDIIMEDCKPYVWIVFLSNW